MMFFRTFLLSLVAFVYVVPAATAAETDSDLELGPNWRVIDVYYHHEWNRNDNREADFIGLRASANIRNNGLFRIETNGGKISDRINNVEREYNGYQQTFMGGVRYAASEQADIFWLVGATRVEFETNYYNLNRHGLISQFGMRGMLTPAWDLTSYFQIQKTGGMTTTSLHADIRYRAWRRVDVYAGAGLFANDRSGRIGLSFHF
ncbi:outer membrane beta-barrel protein [Aliidiomarina haloalkalitolerans]|uniref:Uncharacterized protein n=1 Tax=Aliidiomarina haloalkalitolerans TaxID=859059 RepID=A0A432VUN5_9GAMM|nr:outer membrane beta-barrel protein [Aliidiomarina haloalkalitolerans]RUO20229.1 hypothetical protein CWE06_06275 [Aliidiomarina haloalkalitolerans]